MEIQINIKGVKWNIMEFKCSSCRSRFTEWGKKKGKFGGSINCCPNCGETNFIYRWNEEKKEWEKIT
jgi:predicted  nucleic acid-binding Zn-ribbon protein